MYSAPLEKQIYIFFLATFFVETKKEIFFIIIQLRWMGTEAFTRQKYAKQKKTLQIS